MPLKRYTPLKRTPFKRGKPTLKRSAINRVSRTPNAKLTRKLDRLASAYVRRAGECAAAGYGLPCSGPLECAHIEGRDAKTVRFDPRNLVPLCSSCHRFFHQHIEEFREFCEQRDPGVTAYLNGIKQANGKPDFAYWSKFYAEPEK